MLDQHQRYVGGSRSEARATMDFFHHHHQQQPHSHPHPHPPHPHPPHPPPPPPHHHHHQQQQQQQHGFSHHGVHQVPAQIPYGVSAYPARFMPQQQPPQPVAPAYYWSYRASLKADSKPRLSKEEVDKLEAEFQKHHKPSSSTKKVLAEQLGVEIPRVNNWFQNRRAKEKQMKRAAETEAKRMADNVKEEAASPDTKEFSNTQNDENSPASSPSASQQPHHEEPATESEFQPKVEVQVVGEEVDSGYTSPAHEPSQPNDPFDDFTDATCDFNQLVSTTQSSEPAMCAVEGLSGEGYPSFQLNLLSSGLHVAQFTEAEMKQGIHAMAPQMEQDIAQPSVEANYSQASSPVPVMQSPPQMYSPECRLKSPPPPPVDLALRRRGRVPAPLGTLGVRTISQGAATGMPFGARSMEPGSPLRRVASATGYGPQGVRKTPAPPKSPFSSERGHENLMRFMNGQPPTLSIDKSMAPPTPETPFVVQQAAREATVSSCSSEEDQSMLYRQSSMSSLGSMMDQSLRTPPATPSIADMFSYANLGSFVHDEAVLTPNFEHFPELAPPYANTCATSQPTSPGFVNYQPVFGDGTGVAAAPHYAWPEGPACGSAASSPNMRVRPLQFNNMTVETFNLRK